VGCCRTFSGSPFAGRIGVNLAVLSGGNFKYLATIAAQINNGMAAPSVESATLLQHEAAFLTGFDGLTNHSKSPPSVYY